MASYAFFRLIDFENELFNLWISFMIIQANFSDIGQGRWNLTRPDGPKSESVGGTQSFGSSKPNRCPPGARFKPLFQGQTYLATDTKTGLILLILGIDEYAC